MKHQPSQNVDYRRAIERSTTLCALLDASYVIIYANRSMQQTIAPGGVSITGSSWFDTLPPNERVDEEKRLRALAPGAPAQTHEQCRRGIDGSRRWIRWSIHAVDHQASKGSVAYHVEGADISGERAALATLSRRDAELRRAQQVAHVGSWSLDLQNGELVWSDETRQIFGFTAEQAVSYESFLAAVHPSDRDFVDHSWRQALKGEPYRVEHRVLVGAETRWVSERAEFARREDGRITNALGTVQDVTEHKLVQAELLAAQKMDAVGRLAGGISHDFNNILTGIMGLTSSLMVLHANHPRSQDELKQLMGLAERAAGLTGQLLAYSRRQPFAPRVVDINVLFSDLGTMLDRLVGDHIELVTDFDPSCDPVRADPGQVEQMLLNLAVNARDAIEEHTEGGRIEIRTFPTEVGADSPLVTLGLAIGRYTGFSVQDTGAGIRDEDLSHIFEPFFTTKAPGRGTGLGLATLFGTIQQHQGHVSVHSQPGQGTRFEVLIPAARGARPRLALQTGPLAPATGGNETVLIVEDAKPVLALMKTSLERLGYATITATSAEEALALIADRGAAPDLLISDVLLPKLSGPKLYQELKTEYPRLRALFVSASDATRLRQRGVLGGEVPLLAKPFTIHALAAAVRAALDADDPETLHC